MKVIVAFHVCLSKKKISDFYLYASGFMDILYYLDSVLSLFSFKCDF